MTLARYDLPLTHTGFLPHLLGFLCIITSRSHSTSWTFLPSVWPRWSATFIHSTRLSLFMCSNSRKHITRIKKLSFRNILACLYPPQLLWSAIIARHPAVTLRPHQLLGQMVSSRCLPQYNSCCSASGWVLIPGQNTGPSHPSFAYTAPLCQPASLHLCTVASYCVHYLPHAFVTLRCSESKQRLHKVQCFSNYVFPQTLPWCSPCLYFSLNSSNLHIK